MKLTQEQYEKFHDKLIQDCLKYTNIMMDGGLKSEKWTLTNDFTVSFTDLKRKPRKK